MGRPRKFTLDENYFEIINTKNKAYIIGFIYADGSINDNCLSIIIKESDIEILKFIKKELNYGGDIKSFIHKTNGNKYVRLSIYSKKIVGDLSKIGIIKNKTYLSNSLPKINDILFSDMLRGFFDGDGSIYYAKRLNRKQEEYTISFSSNKFVLEEIKEKLLTISISSSNIRYRHKDSLFSGCLEIRGNVNIEKFEKYIYHDSCFYLTRKYNLFLNFNEMLKNLTSRKQSSDDINKIKTLYESGFKQSEISKILEKPFSTIRSTIQRLRRKKIII
jgi:hypothetical protein